MEGMGASDIRAAAAAIVAFMAEQDIYKASPSASRDTAAVLSQSWLMHQFSGNNISVTANGTTRQFVRVPDGSFVAPGCRIRNAHANRHPRAIHLYVPDNGRPPVAPTMRSAAAGTIPGSGFTVTNAQADQQHFGYWLGITRRQISASAAFAAGRLASGWIAGPSRKA